MFKLKHLHTANSLTIDSQSDTQITSTNNRAQSGNQIKRKKPEHKCLQNNLLYASNLPLWFEDEKAIKSEKYFGKYGKIVGIMSSIKDPAQNNNQAPQYVQTYLTYQNEKQVAIAIAAVNDLNCHSMTLKTTYGTSRLCNNYVNGKKCTIRGCFWLHDEKNCIQMQSPFKIDFQKQRQIAYQIVKKNISYYISKIESAKTVNDSIKAKQLKDDALVYFPSIKDTINQLIQKNVLSKFSYQRAYEQFLSTKKKMSQSVKKIIYIRKRTWSNSQSQPENQRQCRTNSDKIQLPKIEKKINAISAHFKNKKKQKSQFLMSHILESLNENQESTPKSKNSYNFEHKKDWQALPNFSDLYSIKLFWQQELMQTQQSESGESDSPHSIVTKSASQSQLRNSFNQQVYINDSEQSCFEQQMLIDRVKQQILKNRLIKVSILQFTQSIPFKQKQAQFQKVTNILRSKLID